MQCPSATARKNTAATKAETAHRPFQAIEDMGKPNSGAASKGSSDGSSKGSGSTQSTRSSVAKDSGGMHNCMNSYGIKPYDNGGYEQANNILDAMVQSDRQGNNSSK
ncbi:hypothetical protein WJX73_003410 [Symbiochloris irregularis]|uniref:Uncharacterized protein n=1 Tax=Symbiochloris irregularis TaxID=706552 RepID=A0AAW1P1L5_9CHLO